jgi:predicted ester cyclase
MGAGHLCGLPDWRATVDDVFGEGDKIVLRWSGRDTHQGTWLGLAATGTNVSTTGIIIYTLSGGKMAEAFGIYDDLDVMQQLGAIPAPGQPGA